MSRLSCEGDFWLGLRRCVTTGVARLVYNRLFYNHAQEAEQQKSEAF
jgi:hypothetical protein